MRALQWLEEFRDDVTFAVRQLRRTPAFTLVAALTLALGIGANSAIFALVDATLLRPLPYHDAGRLVTVWERTDTTPRGFASPPNLIDWNERSRSFEIIAGFAPGVGGMVMNGADGTAETVSRQWVSAGIFDALGVKAVAGRTFLPDDEAGRKQVVVLSEALWQTRFNADRSLIGKEIRLDGMLFTVVGVVPKDFQLLGDTSMWAMRPNTRDPRARRAYVWQTVGRLKPGVSIEAAASDLSAVADGLAREFPNTNQGRGVAIEPLHRTLIGGDLRTTSMLFLGVVGFVLLICCANVANLLLARATVRARELAMRSALGAGRGRVIRQLLTESLVLSTIGGLLGAGVGTLILRVAPSVIPQGLLPAAVTLAFDARVIAFCAAAALLVGVLFGLAPAWQATRGSAAQALAAESRTSTGRGGALRNLLVAGEVATAVLLLFGAGLLLRTLIAVENVERGYRAESVLTMMLDPLGSAYPTPASLQQFFDVVQEEVAAIPGVHSVAYSSALPMGTSETDRFTLSVEIAGEPVNEQQRPTADYQVVSPAYFQALDLPVVDGRGFGGLDTREGVPVAMVNEAFVRRYLNGRSPIGLQIGLRPLDTPTAKPAVRQVVGVAKQVKGRPDETEDLVQVYVPMTQNLSDDIYMVVRPRAGRAGALVPSVRAAIGRIDKEQLVSVRDVRTLEDVAAGATGRHRFRATLVTAFAVLALLLSMVGVFGILAYSVQQRVRDFGVRRALGATTADVLRLVVGDAARVVAAGAVAGLVLAAGLGRLLTTMLFGVQPLDPMTFALVTIVLAVTATLSIAGPAYRATRVDPAVALRGE
jgi:putative ABC transport system permease protein